ncbi:general odorant-binding protein 66-like [Uranotaenia lowii]|uniref:general odorant-binding protein 66-like n=1 Tax=Uranotaenia lowii TaxID=190385 RepID=UPI00247957ED|nr:general odorant-binding protein 66-like [Uranotaenia lowii]
MFENFKFYSLLVNAFLLDYIATEEIQQCKNVPKILESYAICCEPPQFHEENIIQDCINQFNSSKFTVEEKFCKISDCFFKNSNFLKPDGSLDKSNMNNYFETHISNSTEWIDVFKTSAIEPCVQLIDENYPEMQNFLESNEVRILPSSSQCATKPTLVSFCMELKLMAVCIVKRLLM